MGKISERLKQIEGLANEAVFVGDKIAELIPEVDYLEYHLVEVEAAANRYWNQLIDIWNKEALSAYAEN